MSDRRPAPTTALLIGMLAVSLVAGCTSAARGTAAPAERTVLGATSTSLATTSTMTSADTTSTVPSIATSTAAPAAASPTPTAAPATTPPATVAPATMPPATVPPVPTTAPANGPRMVFVALSSHPAGGACTQVGEVVVLIFTWQSAAADHVRVTRPDGETFVDVAPPASTLTFPHICTAMPSLFRFYPVGADGVEGPPWNFNV